MALTQRFEYKYEITELGVIQIRQATIFEDDGVYVATSYSRSVVAPGDDVSDQSSEVQALAGVLHTEERITAYEALTPEED